MSSPQVAILMGSDSDLPVMQEAAKVLDEFGIGYELTVLSAHRNPARAHEFATAAAGRGIKVIIAAAGGAAHLAGVMASMFSMPVIGVPIKAVTLDGLDSLLSTVQMPPGVPVATVGVNAAKNAGILAAQILSVQDPELGKKVVAYKESLNALVLKKAEKLEKDGYEKYLKEQKG